MVLPFSVPIVSCLSSTIVELLSEVVVNVVALNGVVIDDASFANA